MESRSCPRTMMVPRPLLCAGLLAWSLLATDLHAQEPAFIEVTGSATVSVEADRVMVSLAVETLRETAGEASGANADLMDAVFRALRAEDLSDFSIETFGYGLNPQYRDGASRGPPEIVAYRANNNVRVTSSDVEEAGRIIDLATSAGANRVLSLAFGASDTEAAERSVLADATRDATEQAEIIAESLGRRLGPALEVRGGARAPAPRGGYAMEMTMARAAPTPIEAGDQQVNASVTIRFRIGPPR